MVRLFEVIRSLALQVALLSGNHAAQLLEPQAFQCVSQTAFGEARGEGLTGMALVVQSMVNRHIAKGRKACNIARRSYEGYRAWKGRNPRDTDPFSWHKAQLITLLVVTGNYDLGECSGVTHFLNPRSLSRMPRWASPQNRLCKFGNHIAYRVENI